MPSDSTSSRSSSIAIRAATTRFQVKPKHLLLLVLVAIAAWYAWYVSTARRSASLTDFETWAPLAERGATFEIQDARELHRELAERPSDTGQDDGGHAPLGIKTFGPLAQPSKGRVRATLIAMIESAHRNYQTNLPGVVDVTKRERITLRFRERLALLNAELERLQSDRYWTIDASDQGVILSVFSSRFPKISFYIFGRGYLSATGEIVALVFPIPLTTTEIAKIQVDKSAFRRRELERKIHDFNSRPLEWRKQKISARAELIESVRRLQKEDTASARARLKKLFADPVLSQIPDGVLIDRANFQLHFQKGK